MKDNKKIFKMLALISQVGFSMMAPIFLCVFIGYYIDEKFDTYFSILFLILGILAGFRNCYILLRQVIDE